VPGENAAPPPPAFPPPPLPEPSSKLPGPFAVLLVLLAVSILASVTLAVRIGDAERRAEDDRDRIIELQNQIDRLSDRAATPQPSGSAGPGSFGSSVIERIARAVEQLRGLKFSRGIAPEILTVEQLRARIEKSYEEDQSRAEVDAAGKTLTALGLLAPSASLHAILRDVGAEQIGGYYDDEEESLVIAGSVAALTPYDRILLAHELVHAVTDQHFGLDALGTLQDERKDDEATAYLSLVEGDATLMMFLYREQFLTTAERSKVDEEASRLTSPKLDAAPPIVRESLLFPYERGAQFVNALYQRGGTAEIDKAYRTPPSSTEQIMHPARFFTRDDPQPVVLPDVAASLGQGWRRIDGGGIGEFDVLLIADEYLPESDAREAAAGWDGGRYETYESSKGTLVAVSTIWDSADEARQAAESLTDWLRPRFGGEGSGYRDGAASGWQAPSGAAEVLRDGTRVMLLVGPDRASVAAARRAF